jgi:uncharacterized SAM-binding protein YcdF (DUF218 family)
MLRMNLQRMRKWAIIAALCLAVLWPSLAWIGAKVLIVKNEFQSADAIVVLSGPATYVERADWAARLYRQGRAPVVVLTNEGLMSRWSKVEERNPYFYELAIKELQQRGVPAAKIQVVFETVTGTYEESLKLCDYAATHQLRRVLVVTSAYHSRRALWSLRRACRGSEIQIGIDSPPPGWQTPSAGLWWLHKWGWRVVAGEYLKMIYYRMHY